VLLSLPIGALRGRSRRSWRRASRQALPERVIGTDTYAYAMLVAVAAAAGSALLVQGRLRRLDLIAVLKTRE
jgi:putative ABC transport system permease protein